MNRKNFTTSEELLEWIFKDENLDLKKIDDLKFDIRTYFIGILLDKHYKKYAGYHTDNEMIPLKQDNYDYYKDDNFFYVAKNIENIIIKTDDLLKEYMSKNDIIRELLFINNEYEVYEQELRIYIDIINIVDKIL